MKVDRSLFRSCCGADGLDGRSGDLHAFVRTLGTGELPGLIVEFHGLPL
jgi:hypothetical protein